MATSTGTIPTTPAEFLAWENRQRQRLRWELVGGAVRAPQLELRGQPSLLPRQDLQPAAVQDALGGRGHGRRLGFGRPWVPHPFPPTACHTSSAARMPSLAPPSMKPWKSCEQCSPAKWIEPWGTPS